jgi:acetylornithine/N-succinyldiaminopimelate aminotransferase
LRYNSFEDLEQITANTACVVAETIQAEAGILAPSKEWMQALRKRCNSTGTLLILDEIQAGFGRTGRRWGFEHFNIVPDILLLGKALGGGMPLGAFIASKELMDHFTDQPVLGHITTFGGHPLCCAAGHAAFEALLEENMWADAEEKCALFRSLLVQENIREIRSFGLWMAVVFDSFDSCKRVIDECIEEGLVTDWFLFAPHCLRISPPLTISKAEIERAAAIIVRAAARL